MSKKAYAKKVLADHAYDKKNGIKPNSPQDVALDKKRGIRNAKGQMLNLAKPSFAADVDLGKDGSKWKHGYVPLNAAAAALKAHKPVPAGSGGSSSVKKAVQKPFASMNPQYTSEASSAEIQRKLPKGSKVSFEVAGKAVHGTVTGHRRLKSGIHMIDYVADHDRVARSAYPDDVVSYKPVPAGSGGSSSIKKVVQKAPARTKKTGGSHEGSSGKHGNVSKDEHLGVMRGEVQAATNRTYAINVDRKRSGKAPLEATSSETSVQRGPGGSGHIRATTDHVNGRTSYQVYTSNGEDSKKGAGGVQRFSSDEQAALALHSHLYGAGRGNPALGQPRFPKSSMEGSDNERAKLDAAITAKAARDAKNLPENSLQRLATSPDASAGVKAAAAAELKRRGIDVAPRNNVSTGGRRAPSGDVPGYTSRGAKALQAAMERSRQRTGQQPVTEHPSAAAIKDRILKTKTGNTLIGNFPNGSPMYAEHNKRTGKVRVASHGTSGIMAKVFDSPEEAAAYIESLFKKKDEADLSVLDTAERDKLPSSAFVFPSKKAYPIPDLAHARNALARSAGKPEEAVVKAAVYRKFPQLKKGQ